MLMKSIFGRPLINRQELRKSTQIIQINKLIKSNFSFKSGSNIFTNSSIMNTYTYFNKNNFKNFSSNSEHLKLKDKIKVVDSDEISDDKEDWGEILSLNLEKENYMKFSENFKYISKKGIVLNLSEINKILSCVYNKNIKVLDTIYNYVCDKNIILDSISYYYLILSYLQFKNFQSAFEFFFQASMLGVPQNLSVIIAMYREINNLESDEEKVKFTAILEEHVKKYYSNEVIE
jgi:hypothetical protein